MSPQQSVLTMHLGAILMDCLAFVALNLSPVWANTLFGAILLSGFLAIFWLDSEKGSD
jgi:hypothetical protein